MSDKSFPPRPPRPPFPPAPFTPKIITRSIVDHVVKRFKHLATCQLSCNLTTSSKRATFDKLQEEIRSIASRPAQKVTGKRSEQSIKSVSQAACACVGQKFPTPSPPTLLPPVIYFVLRVYTMLSCMLTCILNSYLSTAWLKTSSKPRSVKRECSSHFLSAGVCIGFQGSLKGEGYLKVVAEPVPSPSLDPCAELPFSAYIPYIGLAEATCRSS